MANCIALTKITRGISLFREDVIKFREMKSEKRSISEFLRDYLHTQMSSQRLSSKGKQKLQAELQTALINRRLKHPIKEPKRVRIGRGVLTFDPIPIGELPTPVLVSKCTRDDVNCKCKGKSSKSSKSKRGGRG